MRMAGHKPRVPGPDGSSGKETAAGLGGSEADRWIGMWSARVLCAIGVAYAVTMVAGFAVMGNISKPLEDPYLAIMEVLILVMAPILVLLAAVIHACAPHGAKTYSMTALGWMLLLAGFTMTVHLVQLTVVRRVDPSAIQGFQYLFNWHWPSVLYGVDIAAWDIFFALALLFAAPVFHASGHMAVRNGLLIAGAMCVLGIIGPAVNHIALREVGIIGYAIVWPIVCVPLSKAFQQRGGATWDVSPETGTLALTREPVSAEIMEAWKEVSVMRKLTFRDILATLITAAVVIPFVGYSVRGSMPFVQDPRGMAGVGIIGAVLAVAVFGRKAFGTGWFRTAMMTVAAVTVGFGLAALIAETVWALLVPMVAGLLVMWALALMHDAGYLAHARAAGHA